MIKFNATVNKIAAPMMSVDKLIAELSALSGQGLGQVAVAVRVENGEDLPVMAVRKDTDFEPVKGELQVIYLVTE